MAREGLTHLSDAELLRRFTANQDGVAFEALVWRHGAMVLGVCNRVLGHAADAEDAFQSTFLLLVRAGWTVRSGGSLAGWLYRVARRVSTRLARRQVRRSVWERRAARPEAIRHDEGEWADWRAYLDREVERLPARYREAFILCYLEGRGQADAARELGCPVGTLQSRLTRAKERLRRRLATGGLALPVLTVGTASSQLVTATVAAATELAAGSLVSAAPAAVVLSHGAWKTMAIVKAKFILLAMVATAAVGSGIGFFNQPTATAIPAAPALADPTLEELKKENERLRQEVASLKKQLAAAEARLLNDAPPTDAEVLGALPQPADGAIRDGIVIVKQKILDRLDPPRLFPSVGLARLHARRWECTVYWTETVQLAWPVPATVKKRRAHVVYIDTDTLEFQTGEGK